MSGVRCNVPYCGAFMRPITDGMGSVGWVCDACEKRPAAERRLWQILENFERRIRVLESRLVAPEPAPEPAPVAAEAPEPPRTRRGKGDVTAAIRQVLAESATPLFLAEIPPRVRAIVPSTNDASISAICYDLQQRGHLIAGPREPMRGRPRRFSLARREAPAA